MAIPTLEEFRRNREQGKKDRQAALALAIQPQQRIVHHLAPLVLAVLREIKDDGKDQVEARDIAKALRQGGVDERFSDLCRIVSGILMHDFSLTVIVKFPTACMVPYALPEIEDGLIKTPAVLEAAEPPMPSPETAREPEPEVETPDAPPTATTQPELTREERKERTKYMLSGRLKAWERDQAVRERPAY